MSHAFTLDRVNVLKILCSQIAVSLDNALLYRNLEQSLNNQLVLTEAYSRFTPKEYLRFLGHTSILDVKLGDHRIENLTVLFADIRSYTSLAEQFSAEENFVFLSDYLEQVTSVISQHKGMVNQLLGDGVLAFFTRPDDALEAAMQIQTLMRNYKVKTKKSGAVGIKVGIGLHTGEVIIGIMGNAVSMDAGIVSDTVNVAARIEGLTKHFGVNILMSEAVIIALKNITPSVTRYVGRVMLKGKKQEIGLYECFESDSDEERNIKTQTLQPYHHALELYCTKEFEKAAQEFGKLASQCNNDLLITYYHQKSLELANNEIPSEWDAIEIMESK
jgi:class 3 adenylate cyclase